MPSVLEVDVPTPPSSAGTTMKELGAMFKTIDTSGDGFLSFDEMVAAARKASPPQSAAAVSSADEIDDDDFATS